MKAGPCYFMKSKEISVSSLFMPTSKTKELAKKLGLVRSKRKLVSGEKSADKKQRRGQILAYLIVMDFESTCWENKKGQQEIKVTSPELSLGPSNDYSDPHTTELPGLLDIGADDKTTVEFPAVLLDLSSGDIMDEFQQYVLPVENPTLSEFCKQLTGISQDQVDNGVPLPTCLYLFKQWVDKLVEKWGVVMMEPGQNYTQEMQLCSITTWSDWDLGVCLFYECKRKQVKKPSYFNQWVNIRQLYKTFYERKPCGLKGSLEDLGIIFTGQEHSGIDDARNTAKLCYRLARDGCKINITKCIENKVSVVRPPLPVIKSVSTSNHLEVEQGTSTRVETRSTKDSLGEKNIHSNKQRITMETKSGCSGNVVCDISSKIDHENSWDSFDEDFMRDVLVEVDNCVTMEDTNKESIVTTCAHEKTQEVHQPMQSFEKTHDLAVGQRIVETDTPNAIDVKSNKTNASKEDKSRHVKKHFLNRQTPSRTVSHVTPVTLLPPNSSKQLCRQDKVFHEVSPSVQTVSPSLNVQTIKETPPLEQKAIHILSTPKLNTISSISDSFKTPSTTQWLQVKRSNSLSGHNHSTPTNTLTVMSGHKVTPPMCDCGKRTKRKCVSKIGPNEGKPFYVCPIGSGSSRGKGCGYFKWEVQMSDNTTIGACSMSSK